MDSAFPARHGGGIAIAIVVAPRRQLLIDGASEGNECFFGFAVLVVIEIVKLGDRVPALQHPDHAIFVTVEIQRLADGVGAAEYLVVEVMTDHDDIRMSVVFSGGPGRPVAKG